MRTVGQVLSEGQSFGLMGFFIPMLGMHLIAPPVIRFFHFTRETYGYCPIGVAIFGAIALASLAGRRRGRTAQVT